MRTSGGTSTLESKLFLSTYNSVEIKRNSSQLSGMWLISISGRNNLFLIIFQNLSYIFYRKRCINFLTSLDIFDELSVHTMFDLFKKNLHKASMLAYIFVVNLPSAEEEIKFIMGNQDLSKDDSLRKYVMN